MAETTRMAGQTPGNPASEAGERRPKSRNDGGGIKKSRMRPEHGTTQQGKSPVL
jgi:hypothetical protein